MQGKPEIERLEKIRQADIAWIILAFIFFGYEMHGKYAQS
jgi:hypothetical protein